MGKAGVVDIVAEAVGAGVGVRCGGHRRRWEKEGAKGKAGSEG